MPITAVDPKKGVFTASDLTDNGAAVVPSDTDELVYIAAITCSVGGTISYVTAGGQTLTGINIMAGQTLPHRVRQVKAAGTTATVLASW